MEDIEKEVLNRYKLWQKVFEKKSDFDIKDAKEYIIICSDLNSPCSGCSGPGCGACKGD